jgi:hypothetical protein
MKIFLGLTIVFMAGCVAIPRGTYYTPIYSNGKPHSQSCDSNANKVALTIQANKNVSLELSLIPNTRNNLELKIGLVINKDSRVELTQDSIYIESFSKNEYILPEWKPLILLGGESSIWFGGKEDKFSFKQYWSVVELTTPFAKKYIIDLPKMLIDGQSVILEPIVFEHRSGELQIFPALNC